MDLNEKTLYQAFLGTLSTDPAQRRNGELVLSKVADEENFGVSVLLLCSSCSFDEQIRQSAAINFKNHIRTRWVISSSVSKFTPISDPEKKRIIAMIVPLFLSTSPRIRSQLSEALAVIGKHDFPMAWIKLWPQLASSFKIRFVGFGWCDSINGTLSVVNSLFKKFRYESKSDDLYLDLKTCLDDFAAPLLELFRRISGLIDSVAESCDAVSLKKLFESQRLCCRIFYSLNSQELPKFFEDHMKEWMAEFLKYLRTRYLVFENSSDGMAVTDSLRSAICDNISLILEKNEDKFKEFVEVFAKQVWELLHSSGSPNRDRLTITAIKFLTTISKGVHHTLFGSDLELIFTRVVIPNVHLSEEDVDLFKMNYMEFIRRDTVKNDLHTRRRISCELLKGIATNYKSQVSEMVGLEIQKMLASFATNPAANWKEKDCAIYLVVSLATKKAGGSLVSTDLVDVEKFFTNAIVPELKDVNGFPMLKAGALKFFTLFWNQIPKNVVITLMPQVTQFLTAESNVIHSYAATCIGKLFLVKEQGGRPMCTFSDFAPFLATLITNFFNALKHPESEDNPFLMKNILRVLGVADFSAEVVGACITDLTLVVTEACKSPKNPVFNYYLFEALTCLVRRACEKDSSLISAFYTSLFPIIHLILKDNITEFWSYAFQLLAQLLELSRAPIHEFYLKLFNPLLSPYLWNDHAYVPALVRLFQAYGEKAPHLLNQRGNLIEVIKIFETLVVVSSTEELGFYVLNTVIQNLLYDVISPFVRDIWVVLNPRAGHSVRFVKCLVIFMSIFLIKYGFTNLVDSANVVQQGLFIEIIKKFWIPNLKMITGTANSKLASVASTILIYKCSIFLDPSATSLWGAMLNSIVTLLSRPEQERIDEEPEIPDIEETGGNTAIFIYLHNAGKKDEDPLKEIKDPKEFLVQSLEELASSSPGKYPAIIQQYLDSANQRALIELFTAYKSSMV